MPPRTIRFLFENQPMQGQEGDSIAGALFRAGVRTLSYSVKYKRPRGLRCARGRCIMCHMEVDGTPGVPTCITPLADGMRVRRENFSPFYAPLLVTAARLVPFPAGFYYRMFTRPKVIRNAFLGTLRRMAGVGRVGTTRPRGEGSSSGMLREPKGHYDVAVVGAGLSGMAASLQAAADGASVLLIDEYPVAGGHAIGFQHDGDLAAARDDLRSRISQQPSIDFASRTIAQAFYEPDTLLLGPGGDLPWRGTAGTAPAIGVSRGLRRVHAGQFVFATGAYDVVPVFGDNDLPGIFGPRALRLLLERDGLQLGSRAVVYGAGAPLRDALELLQHHGIRVHAIVNAGPAEDAGDRVEATAVMGNARILRAHGRSWIDAISVSVRGAEAPRKIPCDLLCAAFEGQGAYELPQQAGFSFAMSQDPLPENRVMRPTARRLTTAGGIGCAVAGELAGDREWHAKIRALGSVRSAEEPRSPAL